MLRLAPIMMLQLVLLSFALPLAALGSSARDADDVSGTWDVKARFSIVGGPGDGQSTEMKAVLVLAATNKTLTGKFTPYEADGKTPQPSLPIVEGRVDANTIAFTVKKDDTSLAFKLTLADGQLRGEATPSKPVEGGGKLTITMIATRRS